MNTGVIKSKPVGKDFGFITVEGQKDLFFHKSKVTDPAGFDGLQAEDKANGIEGDKVTFDTETDTQGRTNAINVKKA